MNPMAVVSLAQRSFAGRPRVCGVWWGDAERGASLSWLGSEWGGDYWFAFARE